MSGHVQCEVSNEQCKTPVKMVEQGSKKIEYNVIKTEIKEEPEPSQMETCVEQLKCEEYKEDMQKPPLKDMLESQGLMNKEDIKREMVEVEIDFVEHKLIYKDGQHEESEGTECVKLMESEGESFTMLGLVQSEVNNERCKTPVNVIKTEIKEEPILSQTETYVDHLKSEESQYKQDMQEAVLENTLDIESQGLMDDKDIKYEVLKESIDIEEHELIYREDRQHEKSQGVECLKLMEPEGAGSGKKWKQTQPENIEDGITLASGGKNIPINTQVTINTSMYTATNKGNVSVNSDNDCTDTDIDVDNSDSTHWKMSIYNDGGDKCLTVKHIVHDVVDNKSSGERFRQREKLSRTGVVNKQTETDRRETRHECEICQLQFNYASHLKRHLRTHTEERPFECEICKLGYNQMSSLKRHLRTHTDEKLFECEICKVRFRHKYRLKAHLSTHTEEKPFECEICKIRFRQKGNLKTHLRTHTSEKPFECEICKVRFQRNSILKAHLITHTDEKPFECETCKIRFNLKGNLKRHLRTHTREKPFECETCKIRFNLKGNLKTHLRTHTGEKPFGCEICQVRFNQKGSLKTHLRTHTGEKRFGCEICQVRFKHKNSLKTHLRTHTGERLFECEICQVRFTHKNSLKVHLRTHTGEKPSEFEINQQTT